MDGVLPISLSLTNDSARIIGAYVRSGLVDVVRPPLDRIDRHLLELHDGLRMLSIDIVDVFNGVTDRRLKVQVMNEDLLDHIEATRWAVAYLSYNTFLELLDHIRYMRWLDGRSHLHLHQIIEGLTRIESLVAAFATEVSGMGSMIIGLLQAILDKLNQGIGLTGTIQIIVTGADPLKDLDLWKLLGLLGLLALGLAIIVAFLFGVGAALATFTAGATKAAIAIGILVAALIPLMNTLVGYDWEQLGKIAVGFAAIAAFVAALGKAFQLVTSDLEKIVPQLKTFFESVTALMNAIAAFDWEQLGKIAAGFAGIAVFVAALGKAFGQFTTDLGTVVPQLNAFFESITKLMTAIAGFDWSQLGKIGVGFLLISGFVWLLSMAINTLTQQSVAALPGLAALITTLTTLAGTLGHMSVGEMVTMGIGLILIAAFVWAIAAALVYAAGPLATLASLFEGFGSVLSTVSDIAGGLWDALSGIGSGIGDIFGAIGGSLFGAVELPGLGGGAAARGGATAAIAPPPPPAAAAIAAPARIGALGPGGALAAAPVGGPTTVDQTVNAGGINVSITADRLEADSAQLLTDDIVAQLQARLGALRSTQDFQAGARPAVA